MSKPLIRIHNSETNEIIDREMNENEFLQYESEKELEFERQSQEQAKVAARQAILDRLGLTEDEARLLIG